tara:strand:- start:819 stop:1124 length:306 start_codon:yes stop_codon:yes gene_type:complete
MATQTIIMTKSGSAWSSVTEAKDELLADINNTSFTSDFVHDFLTPAPVFEESSLDGQTLNITRSWSTIELYNAYKDRLSTNDSDITNALIAQGWTTTESIE